MKHLFRQSNPDLIEYVALALCVVAFAATATLVLAPGWFAATQNIVAIQTAD